MTSHMVERKMWLGLNEKHAEITHYPGTSNMQERLGVSIVQNRSSPALDQILRQFFSAWKGEYSGVATLCYTNNYDTWLVRLFDLFLS